MLLSEHLMPILAEYSVDVLREFEKAEICIASEAYRYAGEQMFCCSGYYALGCRDPGILA